MDAPSTAASSTSADAAPPPAAANRPEMVEAARQFFMNPKVRATPFEEQRKFLREKGCTEAEMDEALDGISPVEVAAMSSTTQYSPGPEVHYAQGGGNRLMTFTQSAMIVGGASYVAYKFVRSLLLPKFFDIPDPAQEQVNQLSAQINELQNSTKFIMDSVVQTLETVSAQQEQLNRALVLMSHNGALGVGALKENDVQRLHTDISIVKSLLLSQNQFAPIPTSVGGTTHPNGTKSVPIPAWQFNGNADGSGDEHDDETKAAADGEGSSV